MLKSFGRVFLAPGQYFQALKECLYIAIPSDKLLGIVRILLVVDLKIQISICSEISSASSISTPK